MLPKNLRELNHPTTRKQFVHALAVYFYSSIFPMNHLDPMVVVKGGEDRFTKLCALYLKDYGLSHAEHRQIFHYIATRAKREQRAGVSVT